MTTASRATLNPARGSSQQGGVRQHVPSSQVSARQLPAHKTLKFREKGQGTKDESKSRDFKSELIERERKHLLEVGRFVEKEEELKAIEGPKATEPEGEVEEEEERRGVKRNISSLEENDPDADDIDEQEDDSSESDSEAEMERELRRLRAEKGEREKLNKIKQEEKDERLANTKSKSDKKSWYQDTVFNNQSKDEPAQKKRFINDTIRNDFHKKFLSKYVH
eukprot:TRINITY_DN5238_c0_g1_i1.p1 TRINITY_DN5238_c0_g1~~TRINITY_DN5238_c0_g1_i1.p1  ORF type:complete len:222 (-),score=72.09 TRINITY_DN5238_c0_g1_i1:67-732(-)